MRERTDGWMSARLRWSVAATSVAAVVMMMVCGCAVRGVVRDGDAQRRDHRYAAHRYAAGASMAGAEAQHGQAVRSRHGGGGGPTFRAMPDAEPGSELAEKLREGATMEEIAELSDPIATNPEEALRELKAGNGRFYGGVARRPDLTANERRAQILAQTPFAIVLGCSDSRVPTEIVFDQNFGSLFVIRVAGNVSEPATLGSIEYAVAHLKSHILVVMGHEGCGAVAAAMLPQEKQAAEPENVRFLLEQIRPSVQNIPQLRDKKAKMREAVIANVRLQVSRVRQNPVISAAEKDGRMRVVGAFYEIGSGAVDFLETEEDLRLSADEQRHAAEQVRAAAEAHAREAIREALAARLKR